MRLSPRTFACQWPQLDPLARKIPLTCKNKACCQSSPCQLERHFPHALLAARHPKIMLLAHVAGVLYLAGGLLLTQALSDLQGVGSRTGPIPFPRHQHRYVRSLRDRGSLQVFL